MFGYELRVGRLIGAIPALLLLLVASFQFALLMFSLVSQEYGNPFKYPSAYLPALGAVYFWLLIGAAYLWVAKRIFD